MAVSDGDRVTGIPENPSVRKKYPMVTGYYEKHHVVTGLTSFDLHLVHAGGEEIDVKSNVRPADRREKDTEFK